jgi:histidinol dehydrogenase
MVRDPAPLESEGRRLRMRYRPMDSTGIYIPGAAASLASSVLMTAVPACVAGVGRIVMASPARSDGTLSDDRLAAAHVAGVTDIYRLGGAYAIAALAYGTETVPAVDFIVGPGNIYATLAKREVFGQVGIEMLPGPSEVVIIADDAADPVYVAADLLSQAEHNPGSSILLTPCAELAHAVAAAVGKQLAELDRAEVTAQCLQEYGAAIVCRSLDECIELANELAPEHMEVVTADPEPVVDAVRHAPAVFTGPWTPVAVGDYVAGPSHTLPTSGTARFSSGLHANDFLKRTSIMTYDRDALRSDAASIGRMARAEGLDGHARSVERRL